MFLVGRLLNVKSLEMTHNSKFIVITLCNFLSVLMVLKYNKILKIIAPQVANIVSGKNWFSTCVQLTAEIVMALQSKNRRK